MGKIVVVKLQIYTVMTGRGEARQSGPTHD